MRRPARQRAIDALQGLALRICVGGGFLLGLLAGLQGHPPAADCPAQDACVGKQLAAALWSVFGPAAAGAAAGLALSLVLVLVLKPARAAAGARSRLADRHLDRLIRGPRAGRLVRPPRFD